MCATDVIVPHMCIEEEGRNMRFPISSTQCNAYVSSDNLTWVKKFSAWTSNKSNFRGRILQVHLLGFLIIRIFAYVHTSGGILRKLAQSHQLVFHVIFFFKNQNSRNVENRCTAMLQN